jgi:hypothetical protein
MVRMNGKKINRISKEDEGNKKGYYIWANNIHISQEVEKVELVIDYFKTPTSIRDETSIPEINSQFHNALVDYATYKALQKDEKTELAQFYKRDFRENTMLAVQFNQKPTKREWEVKRI